MGRKWTNSKGINYEHERREKRQISQLEREVIKPKYEKNKTKGNYKGNNRSRKKY